VAFAATRDRPGTTLAASNTPESGMAMPMDERWRAARTRVEAKVLADKGSEFTTISPDFSLR